MPNGFRMELVASDPDVISPAIIEFDGDGRMYVAELVGYMMDADASHEHEPVSRISRWESTKADGRYDKHTVFADKLVAPRMILPLGDGVILTSETDSDDIIKLTDTNGDGVADKREVWWTGIGQGGDPNIEHQKAGGVWNLDNWIYTTYNSFRIRWTPNGILREPTGSNGGQWGMSHDDDGKMWFVDAGGERGPMNFQFPIHYGGFSPCAGGGGGRGVGRGALGAAPNAAVTPGAQGLEAPAPAPPAATVDPTCPTAFETGFEVVWPAPGIQDMQGGMGRVRMPAGNLNHFTATTGPSIVRGNRVPDDLNGDLLFTEPVGRLIRRAKIVNVEGLTQLRNAYAGSEFLISQDQLFRPVNITTGPDGTQYVADLYHGIIQEFEWSGPGSYLRAKIEQYQLDKVASFGRIWRLRYDGRPAVEATRTNPGQAAIPPIGLDLTRPHMYSESPAQLVSHLSHPNGWWRDTAQRLLILKQDKSVVPALQQMARDSDNLVGRFHALWTLEGLNALDATLVRQEMKDPAPRMRIQAIRASETLYKNGDTSLADDYRAFTRDPDPNVVIQAMLTLGLFKVKDLPDVVTAAQAANTARGVREVGAFVTRPANNAGGRGGRGGGALTPEMRDILQRGDDAFRQLCYTCHGDDGRGAPLQGAEAGKTMAPPLAGSPRVQGHRDYVVNVLLHGLTGPVGEKTYTEVMVPMGGQKDEWIAGVASFIRGSFGNTAGFVTPADVARVRAATASRKTPWTIAELERTLPTALSKQDTWKITANNNGSAAADAFTRRGWNSNVPQAPNQWFQVELPAAANIAEIQFTSAAGGGRAGAGGGRGGGAVAGRFGTPGVAATADIAAPAAGPTVGAPAGPLPAPQDPGAAAAPRAGRGGFGGQGGGVAPVPSYPRGYSVQVSMDGTKWTPVATGKGTGAQSVISFTPTRAKFVRITQTDAAPDVPGWSIVDLRVLATGN
jgi:mono/diheme cytochrome c family protein